jgi:hypothetical protein
MTAEHTPDIFDRLRRETMARIERHGYTAMVVGTGECSVPGCDCRPEPYPYAYSLGFWAHGHAELVTFGLPLRAVNAVMDPILAALRAGRPLAIGQQHRHQLDGGPVVSLVAVPDLWVRRDPGRIGAWIDLYGPPLPSFVQICWADRDGRLPWEHGCDPATAAAQPLLADDPLRYPKPPRHQGRHRRPRR